MSSDSIIHLQKTLQEKMAESGKLDIDLAFGRNVTVGRVYDYLLQLKFFIEEEITELMESLGDGSRAIHKPWHPDYEKLRAELFVSSDKNKEEAIDILCFTLNACLLAGITPNNLAEEYLKVYTKVLGRLEDED